MDCGRLRLRSLTKSVDGSKEFKLCKKYGAVSNFSEPIVNIYLSEAEYQALSKMEGKKIKKRRFKQLSQNTNFTIDVFDEDLAGLVLCEIETKDESTLQRILPPDFAVKEVTENKSFSGGALCRMTKDEIQILIKDNQN